MNASSLLSRLACWHLRKKYGGDVRSLKPPIGYHPRYSWATIVYKLAYIFIRKPIWKADKLLFDKFGAAMRSAWNQYCQSRGGRVTK